MAESVNEWCEVADDGILVARLVKSNDEAVHIDPVRLTFCGSNSAPTITELDPQRGSQSDFYGSDPRAWAPSVARWGRLRLHQVCSGIDVDIYLSKGILEYDLRIDTNADLGALAIHVEGSQGMTLLESGDLEIRTARGKLLHRAPKLRSLDGTLLEVPCR
ncbi:MAG: hypothetical protein JNJ88_08025, partial [Planctomycetes bacterium]|nr:hypothetical protein [Planctomycetota bacterium]